MLNTIANTKSSYIFPLWFMRQSGRYLPNYKKIREKYSFMDILKNPELIVTLTLLPLDYFKPDFLIIFSDISIVFSLMEGLQYEIVESKGPVVNFENLNSIKLKPQSEILENIGKSIQILKKEQELPIIGFIGGIYTTFSYLIKNSNLDKSLIYSNEEILMLITEALYITAEYQIKNGADIIQIFDTYLTELSPLEIEFYILPFYKLLLNKLKSNYNVPIIFFSLNTFNILEYINEIKIDCLSVDWRKDLDIYFNNFKGCIQGNLDPFVLTIEDKQQFQKVLDLSLIRIFKSFENQQNLNKYIFNTGHGLLPNTKIENIQFLLEKLRKN
ncbi:MAG: uroporphyrinogen decarboxylase family protein [bacterium]